MRFYIVIWVVIASIFSNSLPIYSQTISFTIESYRNKLKSPKLLKVFLRELRFKTTKKDLPFLLKILKEGNQDFRIAAIDKLANLNDKRAVMPLINLLKRESLSLVKEHAVYALSNLDDKRAIPVLVEILKSSDNGLFKSATLSLGWLADPQVTPVLLDVMQNGHPAYKREFAARALGYMEDKSAIEPLSSALKVEKDKKTCASIILALGRLKAKSALPQLFEILKSHSDSLTKQSAVSAIQFIKDPISVPVLIEALKDSDEKVRKRVILALNVFKSHLAVMPLIETLTDSRSTIRNQAAIALSYLKDERSVQPLLTVLKTDEDKYVRVSAAYALGKIGNTSATSNLVELLQHPESFIREAGAKSLASLKEPSTVPALIKVLKQDKHPKVRAMASYALGQIKDHQALESLIGALNNDGEDRVRYTAASALGYLGDKRAVSALTRALKDKDKNVRVRTARALGQLRSSDAIAGLIATLTNKSEHKHVRYEALKALSGMLSSSSDASNRGVTLLKEVNPSTEILPAIITALDDPEFKIRLYAFRRLDNHEVKPEQLLSKESQSSLPYQFEIRLLRAKLMFKTGNYQQSLALTRDVLGKLENNWPLKVRASWLLSDILFKLNQPSQIISILDKLPRQIDTEFLKKDFWANKNNPMTNTYLRLGKAFLLLKKSTEAEQAYLRAQKQYKYEKKNYFHFNDALEAQILFGLGEAQIQKGKANLLAGVQMVEDKQIKDKETINQQQKALEKIIHLEIADGNQEEAFRILEKYKLTSLKREFEKMNVQFVDPKKQKAIEELRQLQGQKETVSLALKETQLSTKKRAELKAKKRTLEKKYRKLARSFYKQFPAIGNMVKIKPLDVERVRENLPDDVLLLQYLVTDKTIYIFGLSASDLFIESVAIERSQLQKKIQNFRASLKDKVSVDNISAELSTILLKPIMNELNGVSKVGIIPSQELHRLPFQALKVKEQYLIDTHQLFYLVSASLLDLMKEKSDANYEILALGNADGSLPYSEEEVKQIKQILPRTTILLNDKATEAAVRNTIGKQTLHLATHGYVNYQEPNQSYILLSQGQQHDGKLTLSEIYGMDWKYQLIFLSACDTGVGKAMIGNEVDSLGNAFISGGAKSIISTLWPVDDQATGLLSQYFYQGIKQGLAKGKAMQEAQKKLKSDPQYQAPYYWAAFNLTGNWK